MSRLWRSAEDRYSDVRRAIPGDALEQCLIQTRLCDCMLLVGTSATVYPAAGFPLEVRQAGGRLIEVNPLETPLSPLCDVVLRAPAGTALPLLAHELKRLTKD